MATPHGPETAFEEITVRAASSGLLARDPSGLTQKSISMGLFNLKAFGAVCWCEGDSRQESAANTVGKRCAVRQDLSSLEVH